MLIGADAAGTAGAQIPPGTAYVYVRGATTPPLDASAAVDAIGQRHI